MFLPFYRGDGAWLQRLQAVEFMQKVEFLQRLRTDYAPQENGLNLPISSEFFDKMASPEYLHQRFGRKYNAQSNSLVAGFKSLQDFCRQKSVRSMTDLGAEFDFSISLYVDQYCIREESLDRIMAPMKLAQIPQAAQSWIDLGFMRYGENGCKEAMHYFKQALEIEPGLYPLLYRIGLIHLNVPELADENSAFYRCKTCGEFAENRGDTDMAGRAFLHAAFAAYLLTRDQEAMQLAQKAITMNSSMVEGYYLYAKIAVMHDTASAAIKIRTAIAMDNQYLFKAAADRDMEPIQEQLFAELHKEAEAKAAVSAAEFEVKREYIKTAARFINEHEVRMDQVGAHRDFFERINSDFMTLADIHKRNTFFDFLLFNEQYDDFCGKWFTKQFEERLQKKIADLQEHSRQYTDLEDELNRYSLNQKSAQWLSCVFINLSFMGLIYSMVQSTLFSPGWYLVILLFVMISLLFLYPDHLLFDLERMLKRITRHRLHSSLITSFIANLKEHVQGTHCIIHMTTNTLMLACAMIFSGLPEPAPRPRITYIWIFLTFIFVLLCRRNTQAIKAAQDKKIDLEMKINEVIQYPLTEDSIL